MSNRSIPFFMGDIPNQYITGIEIKPDSIHFYCDAGYEEKLYNLLPLFLSNYGEIVKGYRQVFIRLKQTEK